MGRILTLRSRIKTMQDLSAHIMDIAQNSVRAKATFIGITIVESAEADTFALSIEDNGCGMDAATVARCIDPFYTSRTVRKVGLGLPLLKQNAEMTGGNFSITSEPGVGTTVKAVFGRSHLDRPPMGNMAETVMLLVFANPDMHIVYSHTTPKGEFVFDTDVIRETLEGLPLNDPDIFKALKEYIYENLQIIF